MTEQTPHVDFSNLGLHSQVEYLQQVSLLLLDRVLAGRPIAGQLVNITKEQLATGLNPGMWQTDWLGNARYVTDGSTPAFKDRAINYLFSFAKPSKHFTVADIKRITARIPPGQRYWHQKTTSAVTDIIGGSEAHFYPAALVECLQINTWQDPVFVHKTQCKIDQYLNHTLLCDRHGWQIKPLHPNIFWLLLHISCGELPTPLIGLTLKLTLAELRALAQLNNLAKIQTEKDKWAGFWEQWLIGLTGQNAQQPNTAEPEFFELLSPQMKRDIKRLPLLKTMLPGCWMQQQREDEQTDLQREQPQDQTKTTKLSAMVSIKEIPPWYQTTLRQQGKELYTNV